MNDSNHAYIKNIPLKDEKLSKMINKTENIRIMNLKKKMFKPLPEEKSSIYLDLDKITGCSNKYAFYNERMNILHTT